MRELGVKKKEEGQKHGQKGEVVTEGTLFIVGESPETNGEAT